MTSEIEQRFPGTPAAAASQATLVEQTRAAAEVAASVQAARMNPRNLPAVRERVLAACADYGLAEQAFYTYDQGGDTMHGPTVALARQLAAIYGNVDFGTQELARDEVRKQSEVRAFCRDWETNGYSSRTVIVPWVGYVGRKRRDLVEMRAIDQNNNSVAGRALREQIFAILPASLVEEAKRACYATLERGRVAANGSSQDVAARAAEAVTAFGRARPPITQDMLERKIGRPVAQWTAADVAALDVLFNTLKRKEITREEAFPDEGADITSDDIRRQAAPAPVAEPEVQDPPADAGEFDPTLDPNWGKQ